MNRKIVIFLLFCFLAAACTTSDQEPQPQHDTPQPNPSDGLFICDLQEKNMDAEILEKMTAEIEKRGFSLHSVLLVREGCVVFERYYLPYTADSQQEIFSVTKSISSALIGIALDQGLIVGTGVPLVELMPEYTATFDTIEKRTMTLEHVLTMQSGLTWREDRENFNQLYRENNWLTAMLRRPLVEAPGGQFRYCSGCSHILTGLLEQISSDAQSYAERYLFAPLGILDYTWESDPQGIPIGGWGIHMKPRDMAKFGLLFLQKGRWNSEQLISPEWVQHATAGQIGTGGDRYYGYHWWSIENSPNFFALGLNSQLIYIAPEQDLVVVITAAMPDSGPIFGLIEQYVLPSAKSNSQLK
jgi:CubicO group peptidase (beta-lactamase class C family)